jgi:hypothetical protein
MNEQAVVSGSYQPVRRMEARGNEPPHQEKSQKDHAADVVVERWTRPTDRDHCGTGADAGQHEQNW